MTGEPMYEKTDIRSSCVGNGQTIRQTYIITLNLQNEVKLKMEITKFNDLKQNKQNKQNKKFEIYIIYIYIYRCWLISK